MGLVEHEDIQTSHPFLYFRMVAPANGDRFCRNSKPTVRLNSGIIEHTRT